MSDYKVVVVEDEVLISTTVRMNLEKQGFAVTVFGDAESMLAVMHDGYCDALVLDIMLPGMWGDAALRELRRRDINIPVLMLTAKSDTDTKINTFETGADDYLSKPFNMDELMVRVKALIRRSQGRRSLRSAGVLVINGHEVEVETRIVRTVQGEVVLSEKEVNLLQLLVNNPGTVFSRADILEEVWGMDVDPTPRTVDNFILKFRKLFENSPEAPEHFLTVRATGYRYEP